MAVTYIVVTILVVFWEHEETTNHSDHSSKYRQSQIDPVRAQTAFTLTFSLLIHLDTKFNPHRFHFLCTLPVQTFHFGHDPIVRVLSHTDRFNSLSFDSPCKWIIGKLTFCSIQWATVNNFQSCSVWPISCRPMGRPRCERAVGTVTAGKPAAEEEWRSCTVNTHIQDLFWLRKDPKKLNELWFCWLVL